MNEFDQLFANETPRPVPGAKPVNEYDALFSSEDDKTKATVRRSVTVNPDITAKHLKLAAETGLPPAVVERNEQEVSQRYRSAQLERIMEANPALRRHFSNPEFAAIAHDDAENLDAISKTVGRPNAFVTSGEYSRMVRKAMKDNPILGADEARAMVAAKVTIDNSPGGIRSTQTPETTLSTLASGVRSALSEGFEQTRQGVRQLYGDVFGFETVRADAERKAKSAQQRQMLATPQPEGLAGDIYGGVISTAVSAPAVALGFINPALALGAFGAQTAAPAYSKYRERGGSIGMSAIGAGLEGAAEILGEKLPLDYIVKRFGRAGMTDFIAGMLAREIPSEIATTIAQTATDTAIANPNKSWGDWASELPGEIRQTVVATLVQAGVFGGVHAGVRRLNLRAEEAQRAEGNAQVIQNLANLAASSKVLKRDVSSFEALIKEAAEDGDVKDVYVNPQVLAQSGIALPPEIAQEAAQAAAMGTDVRIPIEVYAARLAPADTAGALLQHLKTDVDGMSLAEAQVFQQEQSTLYQAEAEKILSEQQENTALQQQAEQVRSHFAEQLKGANRFTSDVNMAYATLVRDFYVSTSQRLGITPTEMLARYPLRVTAEAVNAEQELDQLFEANADNVLQQGPAGGTRIRTKNGPLLVHRGAATALPPEHFAPEALGQATGNPSSGLGVWFTPSRGEAARYGQVESTYLDIKNPKVINVEDLPGFDNVEEAIRFREALRAQGHDGILLNARHLGGGVNIIAFEPGQVVPPEKQNTLFQPQSTRVPTAVKATEDALGDTPLSIGLDAYEPVTLAKNVALIEQYPNYRENKRAKTPEQKAEWFIKHVESNLLWLYDQVPAEIRERSKLWYDGANKIAKEWASRFNQSEAAIAGVLAALSPQKDWFMNVSLAERVLDVWTSKQDFRWDDAMTKTAERIFVKEQYADGVARIAGKTLAEAPPELKSMWLLSYDEAHNPREYRIVTPEGDLAEIATNLNGSPSKVAWGSLDTIDKSISILVDDAKTNLSSQLGIMHKVRNFYNNIFEPGSERGEVTIDTHAVAAALLRPLSGDSTEVGHNFAKGASSSITGVKGTYGIYAEAYRRAAAQRGILPREMQSVTWEAVRGLFTPGFKSQQRNTDAVDKVWSDFKKRRLSYEDARQRVLELAGGIHSPSWFQPDAGTDEDARVSDDAAGLPRSDLPGGGAQPGAGGSVSGDTGRAGVTLDQGPAPESGTRILFEVAPDPNNVELTRQWDLLDPERKIAVSQNIAQDLIPKILAAVGGEGKLAIQFGGYQGATNPSFSLTLAKGTDPSVVTDATKIAGYALGQDSMMVVAHEAFPGASDVDVITVDGVEDATGTYDRLWELEQDGEKLVGGHTTVGGQMSILNYSNMDSAQLAQLISDKLGGEHEVSIHKGFAWFPEKKEYNYAEGEGLQADGLPEGDPSVRASARRLRAEASRALEAELAKSPAAEQETALDQASRGQISFGSSIQQGATISLLRNADLSTFLHETGHFFLEVLADIARQPGAPAQVLEDIGKTFTWFGVESLAVWDQMTLEEKRPYHEQFARGFEAYLFEGKAPSTELRTLFGRFRAWLKNIYQSLNALSVTLTDEVRGVMDRLVATDAQIADAQALQGYTPVFTDAVAAGMTPEQWAAYQALGDEATENAVDELQRRSLNDMRWATNARSRALRELQAEAKEKRAAMRAEVSAEVYQEPEYAVQRFLRNGILPDGSDAARLSDMRHKLDIDQLKAEFGDGPAARWRYLSVGRNGLAGKDGLAPSVVADMFGFTSVDEMVAKILEAQPVSEVIEGITDQRMLERYGDLADQQAIEQAANEAVHNEARARFVATELRALTRATAPVRQMTKAAKLFAEETVARRKVRDIRPGPHLAAEARAAKTAEKLVIAGKPAEAGIEKRTQLVNHYLARVSADAVGEVQKALRFLKKFESEGTRKNLDQDYLDQIDQLLERFDLRAVSGRELRRRESLVKWVEQQQALGFDPVIDQDKLGEARRQHYSLMPLEDFRGLIDAVKNIEHLGRLKHKLLTAKDAREFAAIVDEASNSIRDNAGPERKLQLEEPKGVLPWLEGFSAQHRKLSSLVRQMDGGKDAGIMWRILGRTMNESGTREAAMLAEATKKLGGLYKPILAMKGGTTGDKIYIPEIRDSLTRGGRLAVALNWGNEQNRQRLRDGDVWTDAQVGAILKHLTREEWQFVQGVWDFIGSYWPDVAAKEQRVTGLAPERVQALPFEVAFPDGTTMQLQGGYYPAKYDVNRDDRAEKHDAAAIHQDMLRGAYTRATTRRSHTKQRSEEVKRPLRKSLDIITQHVSEVVHDLVWHEWLIDANRIIDAKPINSAIREHYGPAVIRTIKDALQGIATADIVPQTKGDALLMHLRANVSRATMGISLTTAALQPFGLTQSMVRIGAKHVLRGAARWAGDATRFENSLVWIREKSPFMQLRSTTFNRELHEITGRVSKGKSQAQAIYEASLFMLMQKMQLVADVPTWIGQYEKALAEGKDDAMAVSLADQAVLDSQGGGQTKDMAELQRKHPMLSLFYSYFNVTYNLIAESTAKTDFKSPAAVAGWMSDMALLAIVPALLPQIILALLRGEDADDPEKVAKNLVEWQAGYMLGTAMFARELSGPVSGFDYAGPPAGRIISDLAKLGTQLKQGEVDEGLVIAGVRLLGTAIGVPTVQIVRSYRGWRAWEEGDAPVSSILFGPPHKG